MTPISEAEFERIVAGILEDRDVIIGHNPIGSPDEILLWMLLSCLVTYLSLEASETPCFTGRSDAAVYRDAIRSILRNRKQPDFDDEPYIDKLTHE